MSDVNLKNDIDRIADEVGLGITRSPKRPNRQIKKLTKPKLPDNAKEASSQSTKDKDRDSSERRVPKREIRKLTKPSSRSTDESSKESSQSTPINQVISLDAAKETLKGAMEQLQLLVELREQDSKVDGQSEKLQKRTESKHCLPSNGTSNQSYFGCHEHSTSERSQDFCRNSHDVSRSNTNWKTQMLEKTSVSKEKIQNEPQVETANSKSFKLAKLFERLRARSAEKDNCTYPSENSPTLPQQSTPLVPSATSAPTQNPLQERPSSLPLSKQVSQPSNPKAFQATPIRSQPSPKQPSQVSSSKTAFSTSPTSVPTKTPTPPQQSPAKASPTAKPVKHLNNPQFRKSSPSSTRNMDFDLDSVTYSKRRQDYSKCFNCGRFGHQFTKCTEPSIGIFCTTCGWENVTKAHCPFCNGKLIRPGSTKPVPIGGDAHKRF